MYVLRCILTRPAVFGVVLAKNACPNFLSVGPSSSLGTISSNQLRLLSEHTIQEHPPDDVESKETLKKEALRNLLAKYHTKRVDFKDMEGTGLATHHTRIKSSSNKVYLSILNEHDGPWILLGKNNPNKKSEITLSPMAAKIMYRKLEEIWDWVRKNWKKDISHDGYYYEPVTKPEGVVYTTKFVDDNNFLYTLKLFGKTPEAMKEKPMLEIVKFKFTEDTQKKTNTLKISSNLIGKTAYQVKRLVQVLEPEWEPVVKKLEEKILSPAMQAYIAKRKSRLTRIREKVREIRKEQKRIRMMTPKKRRVDKNSDDEHNPEKKPYVKEADVKTKNSKYSPE